MTVAYLNLTGSFSGAYTPPAGWTLTGTMKWTAYSAGHVAGNSGVSHIRYDTYIPGTKTAIAQCELHGAIGSTGWSLTFLNTALNGIQLSVGDASITVKNIVSNAGGSTIATLNITNNTNAIWGLQYNDVNGDFVVYKDYVSVLTGNYAAFATNTNLLGGFGSYVNGNPPSFTFFALTTDVPERPSLDFTGMTNVTPYNPPAGWKAFQTPAQIISGNWASTGTSASNTIWAYDVPSNGPVFVEVICGLMPGADSTGIAFVDTNGTGYIILVRSTDARVFAVTAGILGAQLGANYTGTFAENQKVTALIAPGSDRIQLYRDRTLVQSWSGATIPNGVRGGITSRSYLGVMKGVTVTRFIGPYSIISINGNLPVSVGQTNISVIAAGFSGLPTAITTNVTGLVCSNISGTANAFTFSVNDRIENGVYPKDNTPVTYTVTKDAESATSISPIVKKSTEIKAIVASPILDDNAYLFTNILTAGSITVVNGDEVYCSIPAPMLTNGTDTITAPISPDGKMEFYNTGEFDVWLYRVSTGINYLFRVTINEINAPISISLLAMYPQSESPKFDSAYYAADRP